LKGASAAEATIRKRELNSKSARHGKGQLHGLLALLPMASGLGCRSKSRRRSKAKHAALL